MAMRETISGPGDDWVQLYHHGHHAQLPASLFGAERVSDATAVTAAIASATGGGGGNSLSSAGGGAGLHLNPEGRVAKPVRRRSRASRRTPTTLLNTDTSNFRAMVQQFTGGPCGPFSGGPPHHPGPGGLTFNFGTRQFLQGVNPMNGVMFPGPYQLQFQRQQQQQQHQQYLLSLNNNNSNNNNSSNQGGDTFFQRLSNPPARAAAADGFVLEGLSPDVHQRGPNSSSNEERGANGFMF